MEYAHQYCGCKNILHHLAPHNFFSFPIIPHESKYDNTTSIGRLACQLALPSCTCGQSKRVTISKLYTLDLDVRLGARPRRNQIDLHVNGNTFYRI
jgi:hypothetical protein